MALDYNRITKNKLCIGCGLCAAIDNNCKMVLQDDGFYYPVSISKNTIKPNISKICPGIRIINKDKNHSSIWGNVNMAANAWANDDKIRHDSSSGGVTSALAIYLLETKKVDSILHVGQKDGDWLYNSLHVSKTKDDILKYNSSRYAPVSMFENIFNIINSNSDNFAIIGKPCDIAAIKNLLEEYPQYKYRFKYFLAIFCAGMPSYNATRKAVSTFSNNSKPIKLRYRGNGWPGFFKVDYENGSSNKMSYNESWGNILGKELGFRCKICPDGVGLLADIASGDAWYTKNGYPDFTEAEGINFCFVRTDIGKELFLDAMNAGYIVTQQINIDDVKEKQLYQHERRHYVGWRILIVQLFTCGILSFHGLGLIHLSLKVLNKRAVREMIGTAKRFLK